MCGIAGIVAFQAKAEIDVARLKRMRDVLAHRGPDEEGMYVRGRVGLAHRRLSIIDLQSGQQPMCSEDRNVWITYNGEIYNYKELRATLRGRGARFRTQSDTEVILAAYQSYGEGCVEHLHGMFAFAIWDAHRKRLFMARDRLGIKPLYYAVTDTEFLFGSEIKALLAAGTITPRFNAAVLPEFLANRYVGGASTFYQGIYKLLPGHTLSLTSGSTPATKRYWELPREIDESRLSMKQQALQVRTRLEEAVRAHLISDVPLGLFLSGGVDSTALAVLTGRFTREPVKTFSVGYGDSRYSELDWARVAAAAAGAEHREVVVTPEEFMEALPRLIWHEDEPIAFPSSVPLYYVSRLAREHVKVVLTGEGSDELFLGYNRYRVTAWNYHLGGPYAAAVPAPVREVIARLVRHLPHRLGRYAERTFLALPPDERNLFGVNFSEFGPAMQERLLGSAAFSQMHDPYENILRAFDLAPGGILERMGHADLQTYLVELLMKQDQMSMAASIESRVPFLDDHFVEYVAAMPGRYKIRGWRTKAVLREALSDVVPSAILRRRKKGFPTPLAQWLRDVYHPVVEEFVTGPRALERGFFEPAFLKRLAEEHRSGKRNHADRLWLLMNLEMWQRVFMDGEAPDDVLGRNVPRLRHLTVVPVKNAHDDAGSPQTARVSASGR